MRERRRIGPRRVASLLAVPALMATALTFGAGSPAEAVTGDPGWACGVPAGYTYDQVSVTIGCGGGLVAQYHVVVPQDSRWTCSVPLGFVHDQVSVTTSCGTSGLSTQYHLRVAGDFVWSCSVPAGFTYDRVTTTTSCATSGLSTQVELRAPNTGVWTCTVPLGFGYTQTSVTTNCGVSGLTTQYLLQFSSYATPLINPGGIVNTSYGPTLYPGDIMIIFGRQLSCGTGSTITVKQGTQTFFLPTPGDPYFFQQPGELYGQINVTLPATLAHQAWATVTVSNCANGNPFGPPPSAPYWLFLN
jgi:hypothetical protein